MDREDFAFDHRDLKHKYKSSVDVIDKMIVQEKIGEIIYSDVSCLQFKLLLFSKLPLIKAIEIYLSHSSIKN